jgi:hypothetical protein
MSIRNTVRSIRISLSRLQSIPESQITDHDFNQWSNLVDQWGECLRNATGPEDIPIHWGNWITRMFNTLQPRMVAFDKRNHEAEH